jgi:CRP-like cAMP-binding protein
VISNYYKEGLSTRFEVYFTLDYSVPVERARRVMMAGATDAFTSTGFDSTKEPQVLVDKTNDLGVVYKVRFWIHAWKELSPSSARNIIQSKILEHLDSAGLTLAYPKEDIYYTPMPARHLATEDEKDRVKLLSKIDLFSFLNQDEIEDLCKGLIRKEYTKGYEIVRINENGNSMFVLLEGLLDVYIDNEDNQPVKVARITPGNYFGEMSLLTGEKRSATVSTATDSIVFEITRENFNKILSARNSIIDKISENISERKNLNEQVLADISVREAENSGEYKRKLIQSIKSVFKIK